jgi:hypothetical protein
MKKVLLVLGLTCFAIIPVFSMGVPQTAADAAVGGPGSFVTSLIPFIVLLVIFFVIFGGNKKGTPILVLKEFKLKDDDDEFLRIKGRSSGLLSWILSLCGIDPVSSLSCNKQSIRFEEAAIRYGKKTLDIPLIAVTAVATGISKPFGLLVFGIIFLILGIAGIFIPEMGIGIFIICLIIGVVFFIFYSLKKQMFFRVYNGGDKPVATIMAKKSIIEGQNVDEAKYMAAANALNKAVLEINNVGQNSGT